MLPKEDHLFRAPALGFGASFPFFLLVGMPEDHLVWLFACCGWL